MRAVVAHFRGSFATARDEWLRAAEGAGPEASAHVGSAALAAAYEGDVATAGRLLDRARGLATCGSHEAFIAYVEGEITTRERPEEAVAHYLAAIGAAARVGCAFVEGVARVSLASTRARIGDVAGAASDLDHLLAHWRRTGQATQLWTTARNAADLLATAGRKRTAVLLLVCASREPGAAAVDARIARFSGRAFTPLEALASAEELTGLRLEAERMGSSQVLDLAQSDLRALA